MGAEVTQAEPGSLPDLVEIMGRLSKGNNRVAKVNRDSKGNNRGVSNSKANSNRAKVNLSRAKGSHSKANNRVEMLPSLLLLS